MESMGFFAYFVCMVGGCGGSSCAWDLDKKKKNKEEKWMENRVDVICMMLVT
jgi:hypothetical protein